MVVGMTAAEGIIGCIEVGHSVIVVLMRSSFFSVSVDILGVETGVEVRADSLAVG
jgi:hypothetical protein